MIFFIELNSKHIITSVRLNTLSSVNPIRVFYIFTYFFTMIPLVTYSCLSPDNDFSEYLTKNIWKIFVGNKTIQKINLSSISFFFYPLLKVALPNTYVHLDIPNVIYNLMNPVVNNLDVKGSWIITLLCSVIVIISHLWIEIITALSHSNISLKV